MSAPQVPTSTTSDLANSCASAVEADLGWALGMLFRSYVKAADLAVADLPGGPRGYQLLTIAARALPATQLAIAQQLGVDRTVMTYLLDDLEDAGLVERRRDPADRRARRIIATDKGHIHLAELRKRLRLAEDHVLAALGEPERDTFRELVRRLATHVNALDPVSNPCELVEDVSVP
jgi:DNA-binding MarR family transcriptional regulator